MVRLFGILLLLGGGSLVIFLALQTPSHDRTWVETQARLPQIVFDGDLVSVRHVRNFTYTGDGAVADSAYEDRSYDLRQLTSVWYGISHFAAFDGLAHTFLSFGFADGTYLALSIEARREAGERFGPVKGLFRRYELIYVLADERDVVGVRTHIRGERVQLYRIELMPDAQAGLFRAMLAEAQALNAAPRFYNTLVDNCTTGIVKHARQLPAWQRRLDYRILLPGYSDDLAFGLGLLGDAPTLAAARSRATLDPDRIPLDAADFSAALRAGRA